MNSPYIGRFAPSPTGPLHLGSLLAALVSYLDARAHRGQWHLRIDDIDSTRTVAGADDAIIACLKAHGFEWDGEIVYQTEQYPLYHQALNHLQQAHLCYRCDCTRKRLAGQPYDGYCRTRQVPVASPHAIRFKIDTLPALDADLWHQAKHAQQATDAIIWRKDGLCAYQLAVVVDDHQLGVTHVIRGADLFDSTPQQIALYQALGYEVPQYGHFPLILASDQRKLSKQNHAKAVNNHNAAENLKQCLAWLKQPIPAHLSEVSGILRFAIEHWNRALLPTDNIALKATAGVNS